MEDFVRSLGLNPDILLGVALGAPMLPLVASLLKEVQKPQKKAAIVVLALSVVFLIAAVRA